MPKALWSFGHSECNKVKISEEVWKLGQYQGKSQRALKWRVNGNLGQGYENKSVKGNLCAIIITRPVTGTG